MPLHISRVEAELDVMPSSGGVAGRATSGEGRSASDLPSSDRALKERLRPIVVEILSEELERLRRRQG